MQSEMASRSQKKVVEFYPPSIIESLLLRYKITKSVFLMNPDIYGKGQINRGTKK